MADKEAPPGALKKEVADDVPIMASEGEYMLPANVVRYYGLKHIEKMVMDAEEALEAFKKKGRIGGSSDMSSSEEEEDDFPFGPDELEWDEEEIDLPSKSPPHMAEGGLVDSTSGPATDIRPYKDANGQTVYIPFFDGKPLYDIPSGYTEEGQANQPAKVKDPVKINPTTGQGSMGSDSEENAAFVEANRSSLSRSPTEWSVDDFVKFGKEDNGAGEMVGKAITTMLPLGKLGFGMRERYLNNAVPDLLDQMLETRVDLQGNPIGDDQWNVLNATKTNMVNQMNEKSGLNLNPLDKLGSIFKQFTSFTSSDTPSNLLSQEGSEMVNSFSEPGYTYSGGNDVMGSNIPSNTSDNQYSGSTLGGAGNSDGTPSQSAQDNADTGSGGLYNKGGLIARRKKMATC